MKTLLFVLLTLLYSSTVYTQQRVLLHINKNGKQEAYPISKNENVRDAIERVEKQKSKIQSQPCSDCPTPETPMGLIDTIRYFKSDAELTTNFGWYHQDVALQWYEPQSYGIVKEFWWKNYLVQGNTKKAHIRSWFVDPRLKNLVATKNMGYYKDPNDSDGFVTPYKPISGDTGFYVKETLATDPTYGFDPLQQETNWLPGGIQVTLDSNKWQGIKLKDFGLEFNVEIGKPFGFSIQNNSKISDVQNDGIDKRMEISSIVSFGYPYHSLKFYERGRVDSTDKGWWIRNDYEWGFYVVVEYTSPPLRISVPSLSSTTFDTSARKICVTIVDDNPGGIFDTLTTLLLITKKGALSKYDSLLFVRDSIYKNLYCTKIPGASHGDTVYWYVIATDYRGIKGTTPVRTYTIYKKKSNYSACISDRELSDLNITT